MKKIVFTAAAALTAFVAASPASAQAYGYPQRAPYGNAYGYNNYGQTRALLGRVQQLRNEIRQLDRRNILSNGEARRLDREAQNVEMRIVRSGRNGMNWNELRDNQNRIYRLEQNIRREATDWNRRYGSRYGAYHSQWMDRDHDGRNDRYEDDRGRRHDR